MIRVEQLVWLLIFFSSSLHAQRHQERMQSLDVIHYRFAIELTDTSDVMRAQADIRIQFKEDLQTFDLDLLAYDDWNGKGMTVSSIVHKTKSQKFEQEDDRLTVLLRKRVWKGETHDFSITYSGVPEEGLIITENKFGDRVFFGENWPDRAKNWLPTVDHPSDKATVEFIIRAPDHYQVIANGTLIGEERDESGYITSHWDEPVPLPTKVMVIGLAPFSVDSAGMVGDVPVTTWVFPQNRAEGFYDFKPAVAILQYFIEKVGEYPYTKLANVQSKTRFGGMENASNIFYFENAVTGMRERDFLIAHEIAHQWFGNSATEGNWHHVWLSEGFATYLTNVYAEDTYGPELLAKRMEAQRDKVVDFSKVKYAPIIDVSVESYEKLLNANSYQKGSWFLHMLRRQLGDETFFEGIRNYYNRYQGKNAVTEDFRKIMEITSGQNLEHLFNQWLYQPGHPVLTIDWEVVEDNKEMMLTVHQHQERIFHFPLELSIEMADGQILEKRIMVGEATATFQIPVSGTISELVTDPGTWLLYELATN